MSTVRKVICLVLLVAVVPAFGQNVSYTSIEPTVNAANGQCIDYPPLDDGFGWNGQCRCLMEPEWEGFGSTVAISGNTLAIGTTKTPESCPGHNSSVSIYERSASGSWIKDTEFRPESSFSDLSFVDGKLHVGSTTVYEKLNRVWQQVSTIARDAGPFVRNPGAFGAFVQGSQTLTFGEVDLFGHETFQSEVTVEGPGWPISSSSVYGDIAVADTRSDVFFFSENSTGNWQLDSRVPFEFPDSTMVFQDSIIVIDIFDNMHRWTRDQNGVWVKSEVFVTGLPFPRSYIETVAFQSDDKILLTALGHFSIYALNSENQLVETDRLELPAGRQDPWRNIWEGGDFVRLIENQIDFDGAHLIAGAGRDNIAYVFDVSSSGVFGESGNENTSDAECDYSNASMFSGWGWNASAGTSCPPLVSNDTNAVNDSAAIDSNCDYSDADLFGGWGWNATTSQSCAPLESAVSNPQSNAQCIDVDGDGWGWDGSASCIP